jgi:hypothetical protein
MSVQAAIINGDDLGLDSAANAGIFWAFEHGLISSTTAMANMPGFEDACEEARHRGLVGRIGVHLNLIEGRPITETILSHERLCGPDGTFNGQLRNKWFHMTAREVEAVREELTAQIGACRRLLGEPTHLDSHYNFHYSWPMGRIVADLAGTEKIAAVRINTNCCVSSKLSKRLARYVYNLRLYRAGLARVRYLTRGIDLSPSIDNLSGIVEVIVHPKMINGKRVVDAENGAELTSVLKVLKRVKLISYRERLSSSSKCLPAF